MRALYEKIDEWQTVNQTCLLSVSVQQDEGRFCCIALSNPVEVHLVDTMGQSINAVTLRNGNNALCVWQ